MMDSLHAFYCSKKWIDLSLMLKQESVGICERCGKLFKYEDLRAHHKIELTLENVSNPAISLNKDNIMVICHDCHNKVHHRMGFINKKVYVIYGAPLAGKTTYVNRVATRYDLIVDLDRIQDAITKTEPYDKPDATKRIAFDIRDMLYDKISCRRGQWESAYVIACLPTQMERDDLDKRLNGVEFILIDTPEDECIKRAYELNKNEVVVNNQIKWIRKYFDSKC